MKHKQEGKGRDRSASVNKVSGPASTKQIPEGTGDAKPAKPAEQLTATERETLGKFEEKIESGLASFVEVGASLNKIKTSRLYREKSKTFEDYCEVRWGLSRQYAYRLINASGCYDKLKARLPRGAILPTNESQVRPMVDLKPEQCEKAWKQVIGNTAGGKVTAEAIEEVVRGIVGTSTHSKPKVQKKAEARSADKTRKDRRDGQTGAWQLESIAK